jgi:Flp pilus assembly pilin Flp
MSHLVMLLQRFSKDESGAALVEYAVIFAVILAGTIGLLGGISDNLGAVLTNIQGVLASIGALAPGAP